jgi:hypothetical protein
MIVKKILTASTRRLSDRPDADLATATRAPESGVVPSVREKAVRDLDQGLSVPFSSRDARETRLQNRRVRNSASHSPSVRFGTGL